MKKIPRKVKVSMSLYLSVICTPHERVSALVNKKTKELVSLVSKRYVPENKRFVVIELSEIKEFRVLCPELDPKRFSVGQDSIVTSGKYAGKIIVVPPKIAPFYEKEIEECM